MALGEFEIIRRFFSHPPGRNDVLLGVGDDAALIAPPAGRQLVAAMDTLVEGVHFPRGFDAEDVGYRALAVNLSDLAAMGAEPAWALLALTLPTADGPWLERFARGFFELAEQHGVALVGGDTTHGPLTVTVQLLGSIEPGAALLRRGAREGDLIYVSGTLGDAAAGLECLSSRDPARAGLAMELAERFRRPTPRVALGRALRGIASAAIDVSDGLAADLTHILEASGVGASLEVAHLPLSRYLEDYGPREAGWRLALAGGDDYELLFTVPPTRAEALRALDPAFGPLSPLGVIEARPGLRLVGPTGKPYRLASRGYRHF